MLHKVLDVAMCNPKSKNLNAALLRVFSVISNFVGNQTKYY